MEEKRKILLEVESNLKQAEQDAVKYAKEINETKERIKELQKATGDNTEAIEREKTALRD